MIYPPASRQRKISQPVLVAFKLYVMVDFLLVRCIGMHAHVQHGKTTVGAIGQYLRGRTAPAKISLAIKLILVEAAQKAHIARCADIKPPGRRYAQQHKQPAHYQCKEGEQGKECWCKSVLHGTGIRPGYCQRCGPVGLLHRSYGCGLCPFNTVFLRPRKRYYTMPHTSDE